jgi:hypothetical protein
MSKWNAPGMNWKSTAFYVRLQIRCSQFCRSERRPLVREK